MGCSVNHFRAAEARSETSRRDFEHWSMRRSVSNAEVPVTIPISRRLFRRLLSQFVVGGSPVDCWPLQGRACWTTSLCTRAVQACIQYPTPPPMFSVPIDYQGNLRLPSVISSTGRCFPALSNRFQGEMHGNVVSKHPSGLVIEIAVNDSPKAVSTRQKQLDMTHGCWDCANQLCY